MSEPHWVSADEAAELCRREVAVTGEPFQLLNRPGLESAVARPRAMFAYGDFDTLDMALALLFGIAQNHPFQQGNKRAAFLTAVLFLERNGYRFGVPDESDLAARIIAVIAGHLSLERFRAWLEPYVTVSDNT